MKLFYLTKPYWYKYESYNYGIKLRSDFWYDKVKPIKFEHFMHRSGMYNKYVPTNDNWCPSFYGNKVYVSLYSKPLIFKEGYEHGIFIAGGDDTCLDIYSNSDFETIRKIYNLIDHFDFGDEKYYADKFGVKYYY